MGTIIVKTIYEQLTESNKTIQSRPSKVLMVRAMTKLNQCVKLLELGYSLDDNLTQIMKRYNDITKVPRKKENQGAIDADKLRKLIDVTYPLLPDGYEIVITIQDPTKAEGYITSTASHDFVIHMFKNHLEQLESDEFKINPN